MNGFSRCAGGASASAPDPGKRVNFMHGQVLGVGELTQESAFLAERAEWIARDLIGYGTVAGLRVTRETLADGPALVVGSGTALSPRGRPIHVSMPQAVALNEWLDAHRNELIHHVVPGLESPPGDLLKLFVVLCYRQCATDNRPGPGEPCRTDEAPQIYTRIADDFALDLRFFAPEQREDTAVRELAGWLRRLEITESFGGTATLDEFVDALRTAALPGSPPDVTLASPPDSMRIFAGDVCDFFRAALGVWASELRPLFRTLRPEDDCVLLAEVDVPVSPDPGGRWHVESAGRIAINEAQRSYVLPLRLVQELALCARASRADIGSPTAAAGIIKGDATNATHRVPLVNGLRITAVADGELTFTFNGYVQPAATGTFQYVVKALCQTRPAQPAAPLIVNLGGFEPGGIRLRVADATGAQISAAELATVEIAIEVTRYAS